MMMKLFKVYGLVMALMAFNPVLAFAEVREKIAEQQMFETLSREYDISDIDYDEDENTVTLEVEGQTVTVNRDTGDFTIDAGRDFYTGSVQTTKSADDITTLDLITMEDEEGDYSSYGALLEEDSDDEGILNIALVGKGAKSNATFDWEANVLTIVSERSPQHLRQVQGVVGIIIGLLAVAVIAYGVYKLVTWTPPPSPTPGWRHCQQHPCATGCDKAWGTCS